MPPFPTISEIDSGVRADENPLASAGWSTPTRPGGGGIQVVSNQFAQANAGDANHTSYWSSTAFAADCESYVRMDVAPGAAEGFALQMRINLPNDASVDYYQWGYTNGTGHRMYWVNDNGYTQLGATISAPIMRAGDYIGMRCKGSLLEGWWYGSIIKRWILLMQLTDTNISAGGYTALEVFGTNARLSKLHSGDIGTAGIQTRNRPLPSHPKMRLQR